MWPSEQEDVLRILKLEWKQQKDGFETFDTSVNVITQKYVIDWLNVAIWQFITWRTKCIKQSVQFVDLSMNVTKDFYRKFNLSFEK